MANDKHDYNLEEKIKISFEGMPYWIMPRYRQHYLNEDYERFSLKILKNYLGPELTFLDIGAHYGAYSIYAAKKCGSKVIAVEPVSENFTLLNENVKASRLGPLVKTYNVAASDEDGVAEFNIPWASDSAGFYEHPLADTIKKQKVQVNKIDNLIGDTKVDFIKIDTEGHELKVLNGLRRTLSANPQIKLLIEANPSTLKSAGDSVDKLLDLLVSDFEKEVYVVNEKERSLSRLTNHIPEWGDYISEDGYANILCVPKKGHKFALYVAHSIELGGAEIAMVEQIEALREENLVAHVVLPYSGDLEEVLVDKAISYSIVNHTFWETPRHTTLRQLNRFNMEASARIAEAAGKLHPTLIVNNSIVCPWGYGAAKALALPLVWMVHEFGDLDHGIPFPHDIKNIRRFIVEQSDLIICCSNAVAKAMTEAKKDTKIHTVYNLLDPEKIAKMAEEDIGQIFPKPKNSLNLALIGRVSEGKGQVLAIEAIAELAKKGVKANLAIIGPSAKDYQRKLDSKIKQLELSDRIKIYGYQKNPYPYIKQADAVLVCSRNEAFGRSTAEAMMLGKAVIGSDSGGTPEMIDDGSSGLLFKPGDVQDLAAKIEKIKDRKVAERLGQTAKPKIAALLDRQKSIKLLASLLDKINYKSNRSYSSIMVKEWIDALDVDIEERQQLQTYIRSLEDRVSGKDEHTIALEKKQQELLSQYNSLLNSKSWKVTKPLRGASRIAKNINKKRP